MEERHALTAAGRVTRTSGIGGTTRLGVGVWDAKLGGAKRWVCTHCGTTNHFAVCVVAAVLEVRDTQGGGGTEKEGPSAFLT